MADEVQRIGKNYYIQTPNYYFQLEPHFFFPFLQFLPINARAILVQHLGLAFNQKSLTRAEAEAEARGVHLLTERQVRRLFPRACIVPERVLGMTKSVQAYEFEAQLVNGIPRPERDSSHLESPNEHASTLRSLKLH